MLFLACNGLNNQPLTGKLGTCTLKKRLALFYIRSKWFLAKFNAFEISNFKIIYSPEHHMHIPEKM